jgi:protein-S-isoprenylcysteine O-methyltransferase Ste14
VNRATLYRLLRWTDVAAFLVLACVVLYFSPRKVLWFVGLAVALVSFPLWILARLQLGASFSIRPEARQLVTSGLYSKIRNPIYVFGTAASFGIMLALQIWPVLVLWLATTPLQIVRSRREERVLKAAFGEQYELYRSKTWF